MTDLTDEKLDALERAARAAVDEDSCWHFAHTAPDPPTVLALVEEVRRMWAWFEAFREQVVRLEHALKGKPVSEEEKGSDE